MAASTADQTTTTPPGTGPAPSPQPDPVETPVSNAVFWKGVRKDAAPLLATWRFMEAHPWMVALAFSAMIATKVLKVSNGDFATAGIILGSGGISGLASIVAVATFPTAAAGAFVTIGTMAFGVAGAQDGQQEGDQAEGKKGKRWWAPAIVALPFGLVLMLVLPVSQFIGVVVLMLILGGILFWANRKKWRAYKKAAARAAAAHDDPPKQPEFMFGGGGRNEFSAFLALALPICILASAVDPRMWLPTEKITITAPATETVTTTKTATTTKTPVATATGTSDESTTEESVATEEKRPKPVTATGHVLSSDGDYTTILLAESRKTITIPSDTMTERKRCDLSGNGPSLIPIFGAPPRYGNDC